MRPSKTDEVVVSIFTPVVSMGTWCLVLLVLVSIGTLCLVLLVLLIPSAVVDVNWTSAPVGNHWLL